MSYQIISTKKDIERGVQALTISCPLMKEAFEVAGWPPLRRPANDFAALARIITGQLLSVASAAAIWARVEELVQPFEGHMLLSFDDKLLRNAGLSFAKIRTLKALALAIDQGEVDFAGFESRPDDDVRASLIKVHGIGPWTADIYVMFCLGRCDGFAPGDVALANATALLLKLDQRTSPKELAIFAQRWSPWRGVAARLLWHYYAAVKNVKTETTQ